jgi:hypothetical protein
MFGIFLYSLNFYLLKNGTGDRRLTAPMQIVKSPCIMFSDKKEVQKIRSVKDARTRASVVLVLTQIGRAIAQVVSRRLLTAAARVRAQFRSCGICGGQSGTKAGFLRVFRFPLPILIPPTVPHSSSPIIRGW